MARIRNDQLSEEEKKRISSIIINLFEEYKDKNPKLTRNKNHNNIPTGELTE